MHPMSEVQPPITDLIYTRLDLPQMPEVDADAVLAWMNAANRQVIDERRIQQSSQPGKEYPWRAVYVCHHDSWDESFTASFPQLKAYLAHFPTSSWRRVILLAQLPDESVFLHTDPDNDIGWRMYLNHGGPRLYFQKFKERYSERPSTWIGGGPAAMEALCEHERHYVEDCERYPWALTSIRAAHGVEPHYGSLGTRITMLLFPEPSAVDAIKHEHLLRRSATRFEQTAIWF